MEFLATIGTALASGGTGGLLGILGSIATGWLKQRAGAIEIEREKMLFEQKLALLRFKAEKAAGDRDLAALTEAVKAESHTNSERISPWVADLKSLWRPALTLVLIVLTSVIFYAVMTGGLELTTGTPQADIINRIASGVIFLTNLACAYWFGSRGLAPDRITKK